MAQPDFNILRERLEKSLTFPAVYMFKFIFPADIRKMAMVEALFTSEADIQVKESSNNRFISITAREVMMNVDEIISVYKKASEIEGVMAF